MTMNYRQLEESASDSDMALPVGAYPQQQQMTYPGVAQPVPGQAMPGQVVPGQQSTIVIGASQPPQVIYQQGTLTCEHYHHQQARGLGITQIVCGALAFVFQIVAISVSAGAASVAPGIWCGILFCIAGSLAVGSASNKTSCMITATMVMSIISAFFVWALFFTAIAGLIHDNDCDDYYYYSDYRGGYYYDDDCGSGKKIAMNVILLIIAIVEIIASKWQSALCCAAVCCGRAQMTTTGAVIQQPQTTVVTNTAQPPYMMQSTGQAYPQQGGAVMMSPPAYGMATAPQGNTQVDPNATLDPNMKS